MTHCDLPWLWISLPTATFSLVIQDGQIVAGAPYGMAVTRRRGIRTARAAWEHFSRTPGTRFAWLTPDGSIRNLRSHVP